MRRLRCPGCGDGRDLDLQGGVDERRDDEQGPGEYSLVGYYQVNTAWRAARNEGKLSSPIR